MSLLTADDVLKQRFTGTKFREGYDQDEVDDFLDKIVATLKALTLENYELQVRLASAERRPMPAHQPPPGYQPPPGN